MRIAMLTGRWPRWSERFIERDARALAALGHEIAVWPAEYRVFRAAWTRLDATQADSRREAGAKAGAGAGMAPGGARKALAALAACGWPSLRWWPRVSKALATLPWRPDAVLAHFAGLPAVLGHALAAATQVPLAVFAHARDVWVPWLPGWRAAAAARLVLTCNRAAMERILARLPAMAERIRLCRHGLDWPPLASRFLPSGETSDPSASGRSDRNDPPRIMAAGRFVAKKGLDTYVDALALLARESIRFEGELFGEGPLLPALRRRVRALGLESRLRMGPPLPPEDFARKLLTIDVLAHPSRVAADGDRDGVPNAILEAMAAGCAVVAADAGGVGEVIRDGRTGWLVPPGDPAALAQSLRHALADPDERQRRSLGAFRLAEAEYALPAAAKRLEEALVWLCQHG